MYYSSKVGVVVHSIQHLIQKVPHDYENSVDTKMVAAFLLDDLSTILKFSAFKAQWSARVILSLGCPSKFVSFSTVHDFILGRMRKQG